MSITKNADKGYWEAQFYYRDWQGTMKKKHKRGFRTKKEAIEWMEEFKQQQSKNLDMKFSSFVELYFSDMENRLRINTIRSKRYIVDLKILPYFKNKKIAEITASDIRNWQNTLLKMDYSETYLKTINNQMSAIMNYAVNYYDLPKNPCKQAGSIGKSRADEMGFWTRDEFEKFIVYVKDKPQSYMAFMLLYWTGIRLGELLALTATSIDFEKKVLRITQSYQRIDREDVITAPKTRKSKRDITLPDFLVQELQEYISRLYGYMPNDRIFQFTKAFLESELRRGIKSSGVKKIRLHDLRHSHASLLISELGVSPVLVASRLGHEKIETTLSTYSHLYPNQARELADQLEVLNNKVKEFN